MRACNQHVGGRHEDTEFHKKKQKRTTREWSAALFILRTVQLGLRINDLYKISIGTVMDLFAESTNDSEEYEVIATQEDMNAF